MASPLGTIRNSQDLGITSDGVGVAEANPDMTYAHEALRALQCATAQPERSAILLPQRLVR
jgi:hypothetical protein